MKILWNNLNSHTVLILLCWVSLCLEHPGFFPVLHTYLKRKYNCCNSKISDFLKITADHRQQLLAAAVSIMTLIPHSFEWGLMVLSNNLIVTPMEVHGDNATMLRLNKLMSLL